MTPAHSMDGTGEAKPFTRLLVYGTLCLGEPNAYWLAGSRFVRKARTKAEFQLVDLGPYPGMAAGGTTAVAGEIYEVDGTMLAALDSFEGSQYRRTRIELESGERVEAYLLAPEVARRFPRIESGDWCAHRKRAIVG